MYNLIGRLSQRQLISSRKVGVRLVSSPSSGDTRVNWAGALFVLFVQNDQVAEVVSPPSSSVATHFPIV